MADSKKHRKTAQQIAQERLGVADRKVKALTEKWKKAKADAEALGKERDDAIVRRDFLSMDPALPHPVDGVDEAPIEPCPECAAGKHPNCTHEVPVGDTDEMAPCPCEEQDHGVPTGPGTR